MKVVIGQKSASNVDAILMNHKVRLGNKYAFLFNKEIIGKVKNNLFMRPPKRSIAAELDTKLEYEANTSTGSSSESGETVVRDSHVKTVISVAVEEKSATTKKLMEDLLSFEEYVGFTGLASLESLREVRKFTRFLIANSLNKKADFNSVTRKSISLAAILLASERFELNMTKVMIFISKNLNQKGINKLQTVRQSRAYSLLEALVKSYNLMPLSP